MTGQTGSAEFPFLDDSDGEALAQALDVAGAELPVLLIIRHVGVGHRAMAVIYGQAVPEANRFRKQLPGRVTGRRVTVRRISAR